MSQIRFFTDEDVFGAVAVARRKAAFDAISTPDAGRQGESDVSQLPWASDAEEMRDRIEFLSDW
ncbi:MAG: hypothetical protein IID44_29470 [Planctomycetes bacterium]|nr:hypothetical protein [Planctomycetota bacterium]